MSFMASSVYGRHIIHWKQLIQDIRNAKLTNFFTQGHKLNPSDGKTKWKCAQNGLNTRTEFGTLSF